MALLITSETPAPAMVYTLPPRQSFRLLVAGANFNGTAHGFPFVPTLQISAPDGWQAFLFGQDVAAAANDNAYVTFAPNLQTPRPPITTGQYFTQTGMPEIDLGPGWIIIFYGRDPNGSSAQADILVENMALLVEPFGGDTDALGFGPFMLVPGPHSGLGQ